MSLSLYLICGIKCCISSYESDRGSNLHTRQCPYSKTVTNIAIHQTPKRTSHPPITPPEVATTLFHFNNALSTNSGSLSSGVLVRGRVARNSIPGERFPSISGIIVSDVSGISGVSSPDATRPLQKRTSLAQV